jgi:hypothetical protein
MSEHFDFCREQQGAKQIQWTYVRAPLKEFPQQVTSEGVFELALLDIIQNSKLIVKIF